MTPILVAAALWSALVLRVDRPVLWYLARHPSALDLRALALIARDSLLPLAACLVLLAAARGAGLRLMRGLGVSEDGPVGDAQALCVGVGLWGTAAFWLGLAGEFRLGAFAIAGLPFALAGAHSALRRPLWTPRRRGRPLWTAPLLAVIAFALFHGLIAALAPPTGWDVLAYHLAIPKEYLRAGSLVELPWLVYNRWPHLMELVYAAPLALGLDTVPALIHLALSWLWLGAACSAAREELGEDCALVATALLAAAPAFLIVGGQAHSDSALALCHWLGSIALWRWTRSPSPGRLALAGFLLGMGAAVKLPGLLLLGAWSGWLIAGAPRATSVERLRRTAVFLLSAAAVAGPWYALCWLRTGNPIWPFVFGGRFHAARIAGELFRMTRADRAAVLSLFWPGRAYWFLSGPWPALGLGACGWARRRSLPPLILFLLIPLPLYAVSIMCSKDFWRYLMPCFPALALLTAWGAGELAKTGRLGKLLAALAIGWALSGLVIAGQNNELFAVLELRSQNEPEAAPRELYLRRAVDSYEAMSAANRRLPGARLLLFSETRGFYLDLPYIVGFPATQDVVDYSSLPDARALRARLAELGVTYVLVNDGLPYFSAPNLGFDARASSLMKEVLKKSRPVLRAGAVTVYAL